MKDKKLLRKIVTVLSVLLVALLIAIPLTDGMGSGPTEPSEPKDGLELVLKGEDGIVLEYGTDFSDPGVTVYLNGNEVDAAVTADRPDLTKLGTHKIVYSAVYQELTVTAERTVVVQDTIPPRLHLFTDPNYILEDGQDYVEEGFLATDNYDGYITDRVEVTREGDVITYTVKDTAGNSVTVTRELVYQKNRPPVITLLGDASITLTVGEDFVEPGFSAVDPVEGDLTDSVQVTTDFDKYIPGNYTYTYTVTDLGGNTVTATRKVTVEGREPPDVNNPDGKTIYLTFDDGPTTSTVRLLEILKKYNVKATFFVTGNSRHDLFDDIVNGGHAIGVHTYTHEYSDIYSSEDAFLADFWRIWNLIKEKTGVETTLMRFPGGSSNRTSKQYCEGIMTRLTQTMPALGFQYFDWNVTSGDAGETKDSGQVYLNVINGIKGKEYAIVLQHDIFDYSVDAVERIIKWGIDNGYTFAALSPDSPNAHHNVMN